MVNTLINPFDVKLAETLARLDTQFSKRCPLKVERKLVTESELYNITYNSSATFRKSIQNLEKLKKKFGYKEGTDILKQTRVLLTDIIVDRTIQREIDANHVANINNNIDPKFWMPLSCFKPGKEYLDNNKDNIVGEIDLNSNSIYVSIDGQHTVASIRSLWLANKLEGYDPTKGEVPYINIQYIETSNVAFAREFFELVNGKGKKQLSQYDKFALSVIHYELYGATDKKDEKAWQKFQLMKTVGAYPIGDIHTNLQGYPGTISHFPSVNKLSVPNFKITMDWWNKFFHREPCHYALFMIMNGLVKTAKDDAYFTVTSELLDELGAMIINKFGSLNEFQELVMISYQEYLKGLTGVDKEPKIESVIVPVLLQAYNYFGGKAPITRSALVQCNNYPKEEAEKNLLNIFIKIANI